MSHNYRPLTSGPTQSAVPVAYAVENSTALGLLTRQVRESNQRLKAIEKIIPEALRNAVQAGPIDGDSWCLLVDSSSAAAKLRQLSPLLIATLATKGVKVNSIRLKILIARKR